jgi:hypothetical protein
VFSSRFPRPDPSRIFYADRAAFRFLCLRGCLRRSPSTQR